MADLLITGATGRIGRALVGRLVRAGQPVRVLRRPTSTVASPPGVELAVGDLDDAASCEAALQGIRTVFLLSADSPKQAEREVAFVETARRLGVRRVVKLSAYVAGLEPPESFGTQLQPIERAVRASGLAWTVLRPFMFMQNFLDFRDMVAGGTVVTPFRRGRVAFVDVDDVAAVAQRVLLEPQHDGQTYEVTGPEALSFADATAVLSDVLGRRVEHLGVPGFVARFGMRRQGMPGWTADRIVELSRVVARGEEDRVSPTVKSVGGVEPTTFRRFVVRNAAAFGALR